MSAPFPFLLRLQWACLNGFLYVGSHELSIAASLVLVKTRRTRLDERDGFRCVHFPRHGVLLITFKKGRAATDRFWVGKNSD